MTRRLKPEPSRAQYLGFRTKVEARRSKAAIERARKILHGVGAQWGEAYAPIDFDVQEIVDKLKDLEALIDEGCEYLDEPVE